MKKKGGHFRQLLLGVGVERGLVVPDLQDIVPALFAGNDVGGLVLTVKGIGRDDGIDQVHLGRGEEILNPFEFMPLAADIGHDGDWNSVLGVYQGDDQSEVIADGFAVDGQGTREFPCVGLHPDGEHACAESGMKSE